MRRITKLILLIVAACGCTSFVVRAHGFSHVTVNYIIVLFGSLLICALIALLNILKKRHGAEMTLTDAETGVGNYRFFVEQFEKLTGEYTNTIYYIAYIIIDSNFIQFRKGDANFNDIVSNTARVLTSVCRSGDVVARITESGFAYMYEETDPESAKKHMDLVIEKLNRYTDIDDYSARRCFYVSMYNLCEEDNNCEVLLFNLRRNCNKIIGRENQLVVCNTESMNSVQEEQKMLERIERGFRNGEFKMFLQFAVDNKTKRIVTAEALSRWEDPELGLIPPLKYIKVMEHTGTISMLDYYMFERVCALLETWKGTDKERISVSCNVTRITLSDKDFIEKIKEISGKYSFDRKNLILEITEDAMEKDWEVALNNVSACKRMGFPVALDDMGSGYTSLKNLCDYPIDIVKIDRDILVKSVTERGKELIRGMIALAHNLNLSVVCEGVETVSHERFISESDCDMVQGWYYSGVMPLSECDDFVSEYTRKLVAAV